MAAEAAQEAKSLLAHLLARLQDPDSRHYPRYGEWIRNSGSGHGAALEESLFRCLRPQVVTYLQLGNGNVNSMKNIGGDLFFEGRAVYLHGILGLDRRTRVYVGQTTSLASRLRKHRNFRHRRDNPSLHYHALQASVFDVFVVLAALPPLAAAAHRDLPGADRPDLLLNVLEMWACLLFRSLPRQSLEAWLPEAAALRRRDAEPWPVALNVALPLDQGARDGSWEWVDLGVSEDPLVREYVVRSAGKQLESASGGTPLPPQASLQVSPRAVFLVGAAVVLGFVLLRRGGGLGPASRVRP